MSSLSNYVFVQFLDTNNRWRTVQTVPNDSAFYGTAMMSVSNLLKKGGHTTRVRTIDKKNRVIDIMM